MSLSRLRSDLTRTLRTAAADVAYQNAHARREELRAHASLASVLLEMHDQAPESLPRRDELTRVFVAEAQATRDPAWTAALLIAYEGMLVRLRGRLVCDTIARADLAQIVLEAFLDVVAHFPLERYRDRTALRLRQATQRAVFKALARDRKDHVEMRQLADEVLQAPHLELLAPSAPEHPSEEDRVELEIALRRHLDASGDGGLFDLVCRTTIRGERLIDCVRQLHPGMGEAELRQTYNRLKRRRERALTRVRKRIAGARHDDGEGERALRAA